ncbi:GNAT superfamily N-acetyltransferase [Nocardioides zeae]|uniref:GNAT superfamily N-acetyltransferase n=1 Tax=Nocardioides zeae TaxID=1457234 RepID=A0ACC6IKT6_9ACTN|nr:GNAT superfamily N-acetyltransferase [Nocardioides zeae]MDR6211309.1 GNAT superfamily N-acetyltransferase [Nocardioides zeae]
MSGGSAPAAVLVRRVDGRDAADVAAVRSLRRAWSEEDAGRPLDDPTFVERFDAWWARERDQRITWLAVGPEAGALGMLNVLEFERMPTPRRADRVRPTAWGYLANFYVRPEARGRGVGEALLTACTAHADAAGWARIVLSPSPRSVALYARHGFTTTDGLLVRRAADDVR